MCNCTSENLEIPGLVLTHHPGMTIEYEAAGIGRKEFKIKHLL
jgi:hypothetical protein